MNTVYFEITVHSLLKRCLGTSDLDILLFQATTGLAFVKSLESFNCRKYHKKKGKKSYSANVRDRFATVTRLPALH